MININKYKSTNVFTQSEATVFYPAHFMLLSCKLQGFSLSSFCFIFDNIGSLRLVRLQANNITTSDHGKYSLTVAQFFMSNNKHRTKSKRRFILPFGYHKFSVQTAVYVVIRLCLICASLQYRISSRGPSLHNFAQALVDFIVSGL